MFLKVKMLVKSTSKILNIFAHLNEIGLDEIGLDEIDLDEIDLDEIAVQDHAGGATLVYLVLGFQLVLIQFYNS